MISDSIGRSIQYLRLSLTRACAMRCTYCRPTQLASDAGADILEPHELQSIVRHLVDRHGLRKLRLTGGDPTSRRHLIDIIQRLAAIQGIGDLALTTHGLTLARDAADWTAAGLHRVNVSLDTLDPTRFQHITGVDGLTRVLNGIEAAQRAGLSPIKLNTVVVRDVNQQDLPSLVAFAADRGLPIRFIELMPMGPLADQWAHRYVPESEMRSDLEPIVASWQPLDQGHDSARQFRVTLHDSRRATIGFITPMSCNFCANCNRIRIASDGELYPCLMDRPAGSLMSAIRPQFDADHFDQLLLAGLNHKADEHPHVGFVTMTHIGG